MRFSHLFALRIQQQRDGHRVCILAQLAANQLCTAQHITPLVIPAKLHITAILLEQGIEIIALHDHVIKFKETEATLHSLLVALCCQHPVHRKMRSYFTQQLHIVQVHKPFRVINHQSFSL